MARSREKSVSELLLAVLPESARKRVGAIDLVRIRWARAVGDEIARRSEPVTLENAVLTVRVDEPAWGKAIVRLQRQLVEKLNRALGRRLIERIRFVKDRPVSPTHARVERAPGFPPALVSLPLREAARSIGDQELRSELVRTAERYLGAQAARGRSS